jgi:protein-S-isoprenylcysteine O-methyltransferase Ste14
MDLRGKTAELEVPEEVTPLPFVWPHALLFWSVEIWAYLPEGRIFREAGKQSAAQDGKSKQVIAVGTAVSFIGMVLLAWLGPYQIVSYRFEIFYLGVGMVVLGSLLRRHCWRMLGASFTGNVEARAGQQIVTRGAYALLRHPSYTAALLFNTGVGLAFGTWIGTALMVVVTLITYSYRMQVEERALLAAIGEPYRQFMQTRKRIIPYIY